MERIAREKLKWKCRRGLLELDLVLERFLRQQATTLDYGELSLLNELLDLSDNDLWGVVNGRNERYEARHRDLVARIRSC